MGRYFAAYVVIAVVFVTADSVPLGFLSKDFYHSEIGSLLLDEPRLAAAVTFYLLYIFGVVIFTISGGSGLSRGSFRRPLDLAPTLSDCIGRGAVF